jgi:hypothetical protein
MGMDWIHVTQDTAKWGLGFVRTCADEKAPLNRLMYYINLRERQRHSDVATYC